MLLIPILFFASLSHIISNQSFEYSQKIIFQKHFISIIFDTFHLLLNISNQGEIEKEEDNNIICYDIVKASLLYRNITKLTYYSGDNLMKLGDQRGCEAKNFSYHLLKISLNPNFLDPPTQDLFEFIGINNYNLGICIYKECDEFFNLLLSKSKNPGLHNYFKENNNIEELSEITENNKNDNKGFSKSFKFSLTIIIPFIVLRLCISCFTSMFGDEENYDVEEESNTNKTKKEEENSQNDINEQEMREINNMEENNSNDSAKDKISSDTLFDEYSKNPKNKKKENANFLALEKLMNNNENKVKLHASYSLSQSLSSHSTTFIKRAFCLYISDYFLTKVSHRNLFMDNKVVYNETNIDILSGVRTFLMFLIIIHKVVLTFYEYPSCSYGALDFYNSYTLSFLKLSSFALSCWIFIDGFLYCYKLMFWIKNEKKLIFSHFLYFFYRTIAPKFILFIVFYITFAMNVNDYAIIYGRTKLFEQFYENRERLQCLKKPYLFFIPYYLSYYLYFTSGNIEPCFSFISLVINEVYCIIGIIILFYLLFKFKNQKFDKIVFAIFIGNIMLSFLSYHSIYFFSKKKYTMPLYINEKLSIFFPHLMFNIFFLGSIFGLIYFYYIETITQFQLFIKKDFYLPFRFLINVITFLSSLKKCMRYSLLTLTIIGQVLISFLYSICKHFLLSERLFLFQMDKKFEFIYIYEKIIFVFFFGLMNLIILVSSDKFWVKILLRSKVFITINRISFCFLLISELFVYMFFTLFDLTGFFWNYQNILYISCFLCILMIFYAEIMTVYFEIPFRIILKTKIVKSENSLDNNTDS